MFPAFRSIVPHVESKHFCDSPGVVQRDLFQTDGFFTDKLFELSGGDLSKPFETGDFCAGT